MSASGGVSSRDVVRLTDVDWDLFRPRTIRGDGTNRRRVLAIVRHPGPVHSVAALAQATPDLDWVIAASGAATTILTTAYAALCQEVTVLSSDRVGRDAFSWAAETPRADLSAAHATMLACRYLLNQVQPHLVVRTTPATGFGADELIATAVSGLVPVLCVQDFPGIGQVLGADEHPVADRPADVIAAVDEVAASWIRQSHSTPTAVLGWIAHERFGRLPEYRSVRSAIRTRLGTTSEPVALLVGASSDIPLAEEAAMLVASADLVNLLTLRSLRMTYRPHPRRAPGERTHLEHVFADLVGAAALVPEQPLSEAELLALPDLVVSRASVLNLEALAYAGTAGGTTSMPLSIYCGDPATVLVPGYWGPALPSTHLPGGGSLVAPLGVLGECVEAAIGGRDAIASAAMVYAPRGDAATQDIRTLLYKLLDGSPPTTVPKVLR